MERPTLHTFGSPVLLAPAGEPVRFRTRKHFALLIRLAVEAGRRFTRDYLADLLWPDATDHLANHSLAQGLSVLKEKVGREHILLQRATVALAPEALKVDLEGLDTCEIQIHGRFLDGFDLPKARGFEDWKDEWRAKLMPRIRDCLVRQMDAGRRIGDFAIVERRAQTLYDMDPVSEDAVRGLMESRAAVGDRANALKIFARYESQVVEELGAKPSGDLVRMADLLREGRRPTARPAKADEPQPPVHRRFEPETLIGREREYSVLYDAWLEARRRAPRIVVVLGDPGIGKTTLCNSFAAACQVDGAIVARVQA